MSSDAFIISASRSPNVAAALQQALELAALEASQVEDAVFGLEGHEAAPDLGMIVRSAGLSCATVRVSPRLRALFYAAASILSDDAAVSVAVLFGEQDSSALTLASTEAVGRLNLLPDARVAARSLTGKEAALREAGLGEIDLGVSRVDEDGALLDLLNELETRPTRWGLVTAEELALLIERL
jgi:hypothetical protein